MIDERLRALLIDAARRRATLTYAQITDTLGDKVDLAPRLREISIAEDEAGRGLLTALVVRLNTGLPGGGFFRLAAERGRDVGDRRHAWQAECEVVYRAWSDVAS